jgi:ATP-dependent Clp protease ATP-binding subunit ClpC
MFERYTEDARRTLFFARYEASQLGIVSIHSECLLLGLLRQDADPQHQHLPRLGVTLVYDDIRREVAAASSERDRLSAAVEIPFSAGCKRVLGQAATEADRVKHTAIGPEHLFLALFSDATSTVPAMLAARGIREQAVRAGAAAMPDPGPDPGPPSQMSAKIDHASPRVQQIVAAVVRLASLPRGSAESATLAAHVHALVDALANGRSEGTR